MTYTLTVCGSNFEEVKSVLWRCLRPLITSQTPQHPPLLPAVDGHRPSHILLPPILPPDLSLY